MTPVMRPMFSNYCPNGNRWRNCMGLVELTTMQVVECDCATISQRNRKKENTNTTEAAK